MAVETITQAIGSFIGQFSIQQALTILEPLILFLIWMVIYSIFIFKFYKIISSRDIFKRKAKKKSALHTIGYALEYLFLFPIIAFVWFLVIAILLAMLSKVLDIGNIFMISMATLATIRVTAYYNEELSNEIGKLIPFALLAVFLLDISSLSYSVPFEVMRHPFLLVQLFFPRKGAF